eukprot:253860-Chlamydomonas_euryale.AAC.1
MLGLVLRHVVLQLLHAASSCQHHRPLQHQLNVLELHVRVILDLRGRRRYSAGWQQEKYGRWPGSVVQRGGVGSGAAGCGEVVRGGVGWCGLVQVHILYCHAHS